MIQIQYNPFSPSNERRRDRMQLFGSAFVLYIALMDIFDDPTPLLVTFGTLGALIGTVHLYCALRYDYLKNFLGSRFEIMLFRITGGVYFLNGILLYLQGSKFLYLLHFALAVLSFFGLPTLKKRIQRNSILKVDEQGLQFKRFRHGRKNIPWKDILFLDIRSDHFSLVHAGRKRPRQFWLQGDTSTLIQFNTKLKAYTKSHDKNIKIGGNPG